MHKTTARFWHCFDALPASVQEIARKNFRILQLNPLHPSLHFKKVGKFWSARVGNQYRALAISNDEGFIWVWIGSHREYEKLIT